MSEPDLVPAVEDDRLMCVCGADLGKLVSTQSGLQLLQSGALLIKEGHSMFCIHCGRSIHWSVSDKHEERRIKAELRKRSIHAG